MSLVSQISAFAQLVGLDIRKLMTMVNGRAADLSGLNTTNKSNLVAAINETLTVATSSGSGVAINDTTPSTTSVFSSSKVTDDIAAAQAAAASSGAASAVSTIRNGVNTDTDTLAKVRTQITSINTAVGNRVRIDAAQTLTGPQLAQVSSNLNIGNTETDFGAVYVAARDTA